MVTVIIDRSDGVLTVTLNRPERKNAASLVLWRELDEFVAE